MAAGISQMISRGGMRILVVALFLLLVLVIAATPAPFIEAEFGGASVEIAADRAWALWPGDCVTITWDLEGIHSLYVDGQGKIGWGEMMYCPSTDASSPVFEITAENGQLRAYELNIRYFPAAVAQSLVLLLLISPFLIASFYLATLRMTDPIPLNASPVLALLALLLFLALVQTAQAYTIESLLGGLGNVFTTRAWQSFGLVLAGLVFIPLVFEYCSRGIRKRLRADFLVIGVFILFILLLYLPYGFDSIGQKEEWINRAFLEGRPSRMSREALMRFFAFYAYPLAETLDSNSFLGFHLLNYLVFCGKLTLFYVILRRLRVDKLSAFVTTIVFMVYPVNSSLMSLRSFPLSLSTLTLLAAVNLALDYLRKPGRLRLLRLWLALILTLAIHEIAFVIILVVPLLWLLRGPRKTWQNINMTVIWYLVPALKIVYLLVLSSGGLRFYGIQYVVGPIRAERNILENVNYYVDVIAGVYRQTLWDGWREAIAAMGANMYLAHTLMAVALTAIVMLLLASDKRANALPSRRAAMFWLAGGLLFILPSIGVGMWIDKYQAEFWRLYIFVPSGASIALFGLLLLLTEPIRKGNIRKRLVIVMSLLLILPATSRLFVQHAHFHDSANAKASILWQIVEQAPHYDSKARLVLLTNMSLDKLSELGIDELWSHMFDSAIYLLYGESRPMVSSLCILGGTCSTNDIDESLQYLDADTDYSDIVLFRLNDDLTVELLPELPPELGEPSKSSYNPGHLIETSAPMPPRALTMLASARRG
ncbi:MAG: hypothetical protein OXN94_08135 [Chloroflexota bacterium]|nr:hypothetical protein [Chloroflexota bacterium]